MTFNFNFFIKALVWRLIATTITGVTVYLFTGSLAAALSIGFLDTFIKIAAYYGFDIFWFKYLRKGKKKASTIWLTGLSGAGKTTLAFALQEKLHRAGYSTILLDGDNIRNIFPKTGFDKESRIQHIKRVGQMAAIIEAQNIFPIVSLISPYEEARKHARTCSSNFKEIYLSTSLKECQKRDPKGLYKKVREGKIKNFTGVDDPYEVPKRPNLILDTETVSIQKCINLVWKKL